MDALEIRTVAKVTRRIVPFLMVCYFVAYLDRVNVGFAAQMATRLFMEFFFAGISMLLPYSSGEGKQLSERVHPHASFKMGFRYTLKMRHAGVYWD